MHRVVAVEDRERDAPRVARQHRPERGDVVVRAGREAREFPTGGAAAVARRPNVIVAVPAGLDPIESFLAEVGVAVAVVDGHAVHGRGVGHDVACIGDAKGGRKADPRDTDEIRQCVDVGKVEMQRRHVARAGAAERLVDRGNVAGKVRALLLRKETSLAVAERDGIHTRRDVRIGRGTQTTMGGPKGR